MGIHGWLSRHRLFAYTVCGHLLQDVLEEDIKDDEVRMAAIETDHQSAPASADASEPLAESSSAASDFRSSLANFAVLLLTLKRVYSLSEACIKAILLLMVVLIKILATTFKANHADLQSFLTAFPTTEYVLRTIAGMTNADASFTQFVCCPKCFKLYTELQTWVIYPHSKPEDFLCEHVEFPRHPHASRRSKFGATLLKRINTGSSTFLRPLKVYPYRSVIGSPNDLLV